MVADERQEVVALLHRGELLESLLRVPLHLVKLRETAFRRFLLRRQLLDPGIELLHLGPQRLHLLTQRRETLRRLRRSPNGAQRLHIVALLEGSLRLLPLRELDGAGSDIREPAVGEHVRAEPTEQGCPVRVSSVNVFAAGIVTLRHGEIIRGSAVLHIRIKAAEEAIQLLVEALELHTHVLHRRHALLIITLRPGAFHEATGRQQQRERRETEQHDTRHDVSAEMKKTVHTEEQQKEGQQQPGKGACLLCTLLRRCLPSPAPALLLEAGDPVRQPRDASEALLRAAHLRLRGQSAPENLLETPQLPLQLLCTLLSAQLIKGRAEVAPLLLQQPRHTLAAGCAQSVILHPVPDRVLLLALLDQSPVRTLQHRLQALPRFARLVECGCPVDRLLLFRFPTGTAGLQLLELEAFLKDRTGPTRR